MNTRNALLHNTSSCRPLSALMSVRANRCAPAVSGSAQTGFTLIEILVAMTIIAVGVSALVTSAAASSWRADYLREREFGRWVASNALAELQSVPAWPANGTTNTETEMGNFRWFVRTRTQAVSDPDLRRVDVQVRLDKDADNFIYSVTGFVGNPAIRQGVSSDERAIE